MTKRSDLRKREGEEGFDLGLELRGTLSKVETLQERMNERTLLESLAIPVH